jgi:hypothetical protein
MKVRLCDANLAAIEKLPPRMDDKSGIGVHNVDAFVKPFNTKLEDGTRVKCKRKGLKVTLTVGDKSGDGLMRRLDVGPDPVAMLDAALREASQHAGVGLSVEDTGIFLEL